MNITLLYVHPGSGSYLVQIIIAAILGIIFYFKTIWWKIKSFFIRSKKKKSSLHDQSMTSYIHHSASFREPSGFIFHSNGKNYRQVNKSYAENYEHLIRSGLYETLTCNQYLLPHTEIKENIS